MKLLEKKSSKKSRPFGMAELIELFAGDTQKNILLEKIDIQLHTFD